MLTITRRNSESGSIEGTIKTKNGLRPIEYSWDSHTLWINGRSNPEDHPFEQKAMEIFEEADDLIAANWHVLCEEKADVPFTAKYSKAKGVHDLKLLFEIDEAQARIWDKDFTIEGSTLWDLLTDLPVDLSKHKDRFQAKASKGETTISLPEGDLLVALS